MDSFKYRTVLYYYMVPAFLYCLYNNLAFTNLAIFDPTSYFMFMQTRMLLTGLIYQFLFKRKLSSKQWISLLVLTLGCMLQKVDTNYLFGDKTVSVKSTDDSSSSYVSTGVLLIAIQVSFNYSDRPSGLYYFILPRLHKRASFYSKVHKSCCQRPL